jgi:hypothetical protein
MNEIKLTHELFIGKVTDELGFDKTVKLLKEAKEAIKPLTQGQTLPLDAVIGRLKAVDRYELNETWGNELEEHILTDGDWVKWEDIETIIKGNAL